jgi:outer membrane immunogenic protein
MYRVRIVSAGLIAFAAGAGAASAADIMQNTYTPPPEVSYAPAPAFSWSGFYAGGLAGYGWDKAKTDNRNFDADGISGGLFAGYSVQLGNNVVAGIEGDGTYGKQNGSGGTPNTSVENDWNGTVRGRLGYAMDRFMVYGTGGVAVGKVEASEGGTSDSNTAVGWTAGGGVETALTDKVIGRVEYRYTDFGSDTYALGTGPTDVDLSSQGALVGLGFKL